jgi:hypothetical protein
MQSEPTFSKRQSHFLGPDPNFTTWLFDAANSPLLPTDTDPSTSSSPPPTSAPTSAPSSSAPLSRPPPSGPRAGGGPLLQSALSGLGQKRTLAARSPSPSHGQGGNKSRRTSELPDRPRAMREDGDKEGDASSAPHHPPPRNLRDRIGGYYRPQQHTNQHQNQPMDAVQAQIDAVTNNSIMQQQQQMPQVVDPAMAAMMNGGMNSGMMVPIEMFAAFMSHLAPNGMGMGGTPIPGTFNNGYPQGPMPQQMNGNGMGRGQWNDRGRGRGRGGANFANGHANGHPQNQNALNPNAPPFIASGYDLQQQQQQHYKGPSPKVAYQNPPLSTVRPASTQLCKFNTACTNATCPYSHSSPAADVQSGLVLSQEACDQGLECKDKDCRKSHASPAAVNAAPGALANGMGRLIQASLFDTDELDARPIGIPAPAPARPPAPRPAPARPPPTSSQQSIPCKFAHACSRPGCPYLHPNSNSKSCKYGKACSRPDCIFTHPPGRPTPGGIYQEDKAGAAEDLAFANRFNKTVDFRKKEDGSANGKVSSEGEGSPKEEALVEPITAT